MIYIKTVFDVVVKDSCGNKYYIPCIVGDIKAHTWDNGIIQTFKEYPDGNFTSAQGNFNGTVAAEFIGDLAGDLAELGNYEIDPIVFYSD